MAKERDEPVLPDALLPLERVGNSAVTGLPDDLQAQAARRLRIVMALYAFAFVVSSPITAILSPDDRREFFSSALRWGPSAISIGAALLVAALTWSRRITAGTVLAVGLVFEVIGSYGIAAAQYLDVAVYATAPPWAGLSWVAVWMLGFTVIIPSPPRWALLAALGSASAVPVVAGVAMAIAPAPVAITPLRFFLLIVLPYWLVVLIAFVGAQVVYRLGAELKRARQLGAYRLVERLGQGGMGEVWRARHRFLVRPAAVKLIRVDVGKPTHTNGRNCRRGSNRSTSHGVAAVTPHHSALRLRGRRGHVLLRDGTARRLRSRGAGRCIWADAGRTRRTRAHASVSLAGRSTRRGARASGHQAVERLRLPVRTGRGLREGAGLRPCQDRGRERRCRRHRRPHGARHTGLHVARAGAGHAASRWPFRHLRPRLSGYWLVTRQMVFTGRTAMETITQHTHSAPVPPSRRTELEIPEAFNRVVLGCLEKCPDRRPATAAVLAQQLRAIDTGRLWTPDVAAAWWDAHYPRASARDSAPQCGQGPDRRRR